MTDLDDKRKEFFMAMMGVGIHVLRTLYLEVISKIEDKNKMEALKNEFNAKILQPLDPSGKRVMFQGKVYYMLLQPVKSDYNLDKEIAKIPQDNLTEENKVLLKAERDVVISCPLNFNRMVLSNSPDFIEKLIDSLPEDEYIRDFQLKLDEHESTIFMYDKGIKFGLVVKTGKEIEKLFSKTKNKIK